MAFRAAGLSCVLPCLLRDFGSRAGLKKLSAASMLRAWAAREGEAFLEQLWPALQ